MDEKILAELKTLNQMLALLAIVINTKDAKIPIGHTIMPQRVKEAAYLVEEVKKTIVD